MKKGIFYVVGIVLILGAFLARNLSYHTNKVEACQEGCLSKLQQATELEIRQEPDGFKKEFDIVVGDEIVAKIEGRTIKSFGDSFTMTSPDGKDVWLDENGRKKLILKNTSLKYDRKSTLEQEDKKASFIYERITLAGTEIELRDDQNEEIALLKGKVLKLTSQFDITDTEEETVFATAKKRFNLLAEDIYDITIEDTSTVDVENLILLFIVADEENDK